MSETRTYRWGLVFAATWRIITELLRRHDSLHALSLDEVHPGLSATGRLVLAGPADSEDQGGRVEFDLGGGAGGVLNVVRPFGDVVGEPLRAWQTRSYVHELLTRDPKAVVDEVQAAAGLTAPPKTPPSTARILVHRLIAELLERRALARTGHRASSGYVDDHIKTCTLTDWAEDAARADEKTPRTKAERMAFGRRLWAVHPLPIHLGPQNESLPTVLVLDEHSGRAWRAGRIDGALDLMQRYQAHGRQLVPLVVEAEALTEG